MTTSNMVQEVETAPVEMPEPSAPPADDHEKVAEEAASTYRALLPYVKKLGNGLSGQKSVTRVLYAFMAYGLETDKPRLLNRAEQQFFQLLQDIATAKAFLLNYYAADLMEQRQQELAEQAEQGEEIVTEA